MATQTHLNRRIEDENIGQVCVREMANGRVEGRGVDAEATHRLQVCFISHHFILFNERTAPSVESVERL